MAWLDEPCTGWPRDVLLWVRSVIGLRASPRLLTVICCVQLVVLLVGTFMQFDRTQCAVAVPYSGTVIIECNTCRQVSISTRRVILDTIGVGVIACGLLAARWRDKKLLYIYGTTMLFFSLMVGMTAMLTAMEAPVLEVAVDGVRDERCMQLARAMVHGARDTAFVASVGSFIDAMGAISAIRSHELFSYEDIASSHAEIANAQTL